MDNIDVLIIGGGVGGLTAAIYASRSGLRTVIVEKLAVGGQAALTEEICNYPGFDKIDGMVLSSKMLAQAKLCGATLIKDEIVSITKNNKQFEVSGKKDKYLCSAVIIAVGTTFRKLGIEDDYIGKGVSYCATCDGNFYRAKTVAVVGGGNSAVSEALYLSKLASRVYLIHRRDEFRATTAEINKLKACSNVTLILNSTITKLNGDNQLQNIEVNTKGEISTINVDGLFVAVGLIPHTDFLKGIVELNEGYVVTDNRMRTSTQGIFACGDCISKTLRQVITACSDGAVAADEAAQYISDISK